MVPVLAMTIPTSTHVPVVTHIFKPQEQYHAGVPKLLVSAEFQQRHPADHFSQHIVLLVGVKLMVAWHLLTGLRIQLAASVATRNTSFKSTKDLTLQIVLLQKIAFVE